MTADSNTIAIAPLRRIRFVSSQAAMGLSVPTAPSRNEHEHDR